jgi:putative PIG3 family NAD(P)H quinone oxidoreductase
MTIPQMMSAVEITRPGGPGVLIAGQRPVPSPDTGQVLIEVTAAGVNRPDCLQRQGLYPPPPGAGDIPGLEVAGTIIGTGQAEQRFAMGDKVMALVTGGGYGQYVVADEACVLPIPAGLSMIEAAAIPETFFTVWHNVFQRGGLVEGETLLLHGGSSGIGTTAIQLAKCFGARVIVTAGSVKKCEACVKLGAERAVNYREEDFVEAVREFSDGKGADVILDMVGGSYIERNYKAAAFDGRIVQIAFLGGADANVNYLQLMLKRLTHTGSTMRARSVEFKSTIAVELESQVWPLIEQAKVKPVIDRVYRLEKAADAHARMEKSEHIGKIVLATNV